MCEYEIVLCPRPTGPVVAEVVRIARLLTKSWFTENVPEYIPLDLLFQDLLCVKVGGKVVSFMMFTGIDGTIEITMMGTDPKFRGKGYGSFLMQYLFQHAKKLGFEQVVAKTVPPDVKPAYSSTVQFYEKHGFVLVKRYNELWESGALELVKELS